MLQFLFFLCLGILFYTYAGYGLLITLLAKIRRLFQSAPSVIDQNSDTPQVTLVIRAYNKITSLPAKLQNLYSLDYPADKLSFLFLTEGSTDGSTEWLESLRDDGAQQIEVQGGSKQGGTVASMNRAMKHVTSPIVIFSDVTAQLNSLVVRNLVRHFQDNCIGAVVGEKRVVNSLHEPAQARGERWYQSCVSYLNRQESQFQTAVAETNGLLAIRTTLYEPIEEGTLLDDFTISMCIAKKGYRVPYEPDAYTMERPLRSIEEEQKREVSLATGRFQSLMRLVYLVNSTRYGWLSFQYISRWLLRWAVLPFCLPTLWFLNLALIFTGKPHPYLPYFWVLSFLIQCVFYSLAYTGYRLQQQGRRINALQLPLYITLVNVCALQGFVRFWRYEPSGIWNKAHSADDVELQTG
ncbi:glycosyltransferase [Spirosoma pulveris]